MRGLALFRAAGYVDYGIFNRWFDCRVCPREFLAMLKVEHNV